MLSAFQQQVDHHLQHTLAPAVAERLVLLLNHVLAAEPAATARLLPHRDRRIRFELVGWGDGPTRLLPTRFLPAPPPLEVRITPAGLLEACPPGLSMTGLPADLEVQIDAADGPALLAALAAGRAPALRVQGDAALAAEVNWLVANLRWDAAADVERVLGPAAAAGFARFSGPAAQGAQQALKFLAEGLERLSGRPVR
jgi:ubiquinone biosynthesis accessory factor UbiJ